MRAKNNILRILLTIFKLYFVEHKIYFVYFTTNDLSERKTAFFSLDFETSERERKVGVILVRKVSSDIDQLFLFDNDE